ncbi:MAG: HIRAN domain-containing protein [Phycisphaeraceae bacterium]|nr:HIRAN domain-containing protein [Phycisphaeraceae bacterium]
MVGVTFEGRQQVVRSIQANDRLLLRRDPANRYDRNAIRVETLNGVQVGFLAKDLAAQLASRFDQLGAPVNAIVIAHLGGDNPDYSHGLKIRFQLPAQSNTAAKAMPNLEDEL